MKTKLKLYAAAPALALIASAAMATPAEPVATRTIVIEAESQPFIMFDNENDEPMFFPMTVTIVEEPNPAYLVWSSEWLLEYWGVTKEISVEVRDETGEVMFAQTHVDNGESCPFPTGEAEFRLGTGDYEEGYEYDVGEWMTASCGSESGEMYYDANGHFVYLENQNMVMVGQLNDIQPALGSMFESWGNYPTLVTGEVDHFLVFIADFGQMQPDSVDAKATDEEFMDYFTFARAISINYGDLDSDGDGISDGEDACPSSNMDESVSFKEWLDSGVSNYVDAQGCTVMDHYAACPTPPESGVSFGYGPSLASPTYCETRVAYDLQRDGVVDYLESRMLRDALYMSYRSMPR